MRQHLNTVFVSTEGAWLSKDGANIVVEVEGAAVGRVPIHQIGGVVCFGRVGMSSPLMGHLAENGVAVSFLTEHGKFLARVEGAQSGNVLLRRRQYQAVDEPETATAVVRAIVAAKIANQRAVIRRALRDPWRRRDRDSDGSVGRRGPAVVGRRALGGRRRRHRGRAGV